MNDVCFNKFFIVNSFICFPLTRGGNHFLVEKCVLAEEYPITEFLVCIVIAVMFNLCLWFQYHS